MYKYDFFEFVNHNLQNVDFVKHKLKKCNYKYYLCKLQNFGFGKLASGHALDLWQ